MKTIKVKDLFNDEGGQMALAVIESLVKAQTDTTHKILFQKHPTEIIEKTMTLENTLKKLKDPEEELTKKDILVILEVLDFSYTLSKKIGKKIVGATLLLFI
jgi:hypothetical protein